MPGELMVQGSGVIVAEAAKMLGISEAGVRQRIYRGTIQTYKDGDQRLVIVPPKEILASALPAVPDEQEDIPAYLVPWIRHVEELNREIGALRKELAESRKNFAAVNRLLIKLGREQMDTEGDAQ